MIENTHCVNPKQNFNKGSKKYYNATTYIYSVQITVDCKKKIRLQVLL